MGEVNLDEFFCPNEACQDYGKKGKGNIRLKEHYGKQDTALLRCKTCKKTFSENRGTARAMGADKDSVALWAQKSWGTLRKSHGISTSGSKSLAGSNRRDFIPFHSVLFAE